MCVCVVTYFLVLGVSPSIRYILAVHGDILDWRWLLFCCLLISLACRTARHSSLLCCCWPLALLSSPSQRWDLFYLCYSLQGPVRVWYRGGLNERFLNESTEGSWEHCYLILHGKEFLKKESQKILKMEIFCGKLIYLISFGLVSILIEWTFKALNGY